MVLQCVLVVYGRHSGHPCDTCVVSVRLGSMPRILTATPS